MEPTPRSLRILLYSDDSNTRAEVMQAIGRRPSTDLGEVEFVECATPAAVVSHADAGGLDLLILDGEAVPAGGMGVCRQLKNEIFRCPAILLLIGRPQDAWLATWSQADGAVSHPLDPLELTSAVMTLLRRGQASAA